MGILKRLKLRGITRTADTLKQVKQKDAELKKVGDERKELVKEFELKFSKLIEANDFEGIVDLCENYDQRLKALNERISKLEF